MSLCPYCRHDADIDDDLGTCKYCGAPRIEGDVEEEIEVDVRFPEGGYTPREKEAIESDVPKVEEKPKPKPKTRTYSYTPSFGRRRRKGPFPNMFISVLIMAIMLVYVLPNLGYDFFDPFTATVDANIKVRAIDELNGNLIDGYVIKIYDNTMSTLLENMVLSNGQATSREYYDQETSVWIEFSGNDVYCDEFVQYRPHFSSERGQYEGYFELDLNVMKKSTHFSTAFLDQYGARIEDGYRLTSISDLEFQYIVQNDDPSSGYNKWYDASVGYWKTAYYYIRTIGITFPLDNVDYMYQDAISTHMIYQIDCDQLTRYESGGLYGIYSEFGAFAFPSADNYTLEFGLILNGNAEKFLQMGSWLDADVFMQTAKIEAI